MNITEESSLAQATRSNEQVAIAYICACSRWQRQRQCTFIWLCSCCQHQPLERDVLFVITLHSQTFYHLCSALQLPQHRQLVPLASHAKRFDTYTDR